MGLLLLELLDLFIEMRRILQLDCLYLFNNIFFEVEVAILDVLTKFSEAHAHVHRVGCHLEGLLNLNAPASLCLLLHRFHHLFAVGHR